MKNILVTGGAGYIGSHMVNSLIQDGYNPIVLENFSNSGGNNLKSLEEKLGKKIQVIEADLRNLSDLKLEDIDAVIHFAALKAVGDSVEEPLKYYENNVYGTINLLNLMKNNNIKKLIFSSTAAVYESSDSPIAENGELNPVSPYGWSKLMSEQIIKDAYKAFGINSVILRYFNVAGNEENGLIGEEAKDPKNLIPAMLMSYLGYKKMKMQVFGSDYPTRDGTCVRDYIHVLDLVDAHSKALEFLNNNNGAFTFNLGTGEGYTVLEIIKAFEKVAEDKLDYEVVARRPGDSVSVTTDPSSAKQSLHWTPTRSVDEMIESSLKWYRDRFKLILEASQ